MIKYNTVNVFWAVVLGVNIFKIYCLIFYALKSRINKDFIVLSYFLLLKKYQIVYKLANVHIVSIMMSRNTCFFMPLKQFR